MVEGELEQIVNVAVEEGVVDVAPVFASSYQSLVPQHAELVRDRGLLEVQCVTELVYAPLAVAHGVEQTQAIGIPQGTKRRCELLERGLPLAGC